MIGHPRALDGITVLTLEQAVAGPFATRQLADLGARVIKIERATGDFARDYDAAVLGTSSFFAWLNRGKESVIVDLKSLTGRAFLDRMLPRIDVLVQNLAPGAADRLGLGDELAARHPRLISASISGYGRGGPAEQKKAYDLLVQCEAGMLSLTGEQGRPAKVGVSVADIAAGMYTYAGILSALFERERTGLGQIFEVSMLEALGEWMSQPCYFTIFGGTAPTPSGPQHPTIAPYGPFPAADGTVFIGIQNNREWRSLCELVLHDPAVAQDPRFDTNIARVRHREELDELISAATSAHATTELEAVLDGASIANARLRDMRGFAEHPQLAARDRWRPVQTPGGMMQALLPPVTVQGREAAMGAVPPLGGSTASVFGELGLSL